MSRARTVSGLLVVAALASMPACGRAVLAPGPTHLPFASQVDEARTADPAWPHVHVEVVDPTVPDRPSPPCA